MGGNNRSLEELSQILDLMSRAVRTCQVYPPGHDLRRTFLRQLYKELRGYLEDTGKLECRIEELTLYDPSGQKVFQGRREDLFPWALYKNGIRGLALYHGLTYDELREFVRLLVDSTEDLLYFLLEADLPHISFEVAEYVVLDEEVEVPEGEWNASEDPLDLNGDLVPVSTGEFEDVTLTAEDIAYLDKELKREEGKDYLSSYLDIILKVFPMEGYADVAEDFVRSVGIFALEALGWSDIYLCLTLTKRLRELLDGGELPPDKASQVAEVLEMLRSPQTLELIRKSYSPSWGANFRELLFLLDPSSVDGLLDWLEEEERDVVRKVLIDFLRQKVKAHPSRMVSYFTRGGERVKREMVRLAGEVGGDEGKRVLEMALDSAFEDVRKEALKVTLKLDPGSLDKMAGRFLDSGSSEIRTVLFDAVLELGGTPSVAPLLADEVGKKDFILRSYLEKRLLFSALAVSDREAFMGALGELLASSPGWRNRKKWEETLGVAFNVALDYGDKAFEELEDLLKSVGNRKAWKVWDRLVKAREGAR